MKRIPESFKNSSSSEYVCSASHGQRHAADQSPVDVTEAVCMYCESPICRSHSKSAAWRTSPRTLPSIQQLKHHLARLESSSATERVRLWRLVFFLAVDAHDLELRTLEDLNAVKADPAIESLTGVPVE